jgi:hypothetical protein
MRRSRLEGSIARRDFVKSVAAGAATGGWLSSAGCKLPTIESAAGPAPGTGSAERDDAAAPGYAPSAEQDGETVDDGDREGEGARPALTTCVGINLAGLVDWNTELPFVDVFRSARPWISQQDGAPYGQGPALSLDAWGWVTSLPPGARAETFQCGVERTPRGVWWVFHDGVGTLEVAGSGVQMRSSGRGKLTFDVAEGASGGFVLRLLDTDPDDYVRNIRVVMPGAELTYEAQPYTPGFLARWQGMACLRFMDFQETNNQHVERWADRPQPRHATFAQRGAPVEVLVDLANRLHVDPWFCMPHRADDDYVRSFATYVKERLDPGLCVYVEYSNEVWNAMFEQHRHAQERGLAQGLAPDAFSAGLRFYAKRSVEVFRIWESVFGGRSRLTRVLAAQAANSYTGGEILAFAGGEADALAIAPYISFNVTPDDAPTVRGWSQDQLFARLEESLAEATGWIEQNAELARTQQVALLAYEGGQHLCGIHGAENDDQLTALLMAANADPRMGALYARHHEAWRAAGGLLFCHFSSVCDWSKWGSWGLLEQFDDDPSGSPKFCEVMRWARSLGQEVTAPG